MLQLTLFTCTPLCLNKIRELHCWHPLLIHRSYMEFSYLDRHILGEDWKNVGFFSSVLYTFQFNHNISRNKNIISFAALLLGWVCLLAVDIHFICAFFQKKEAEMDTAMLQSTLCFGSCAGMSQLKWHLSTLYKGTDLPLSPVPVLFQVEDRTLCNVWRSLHINHHMKNMLFSFSEGKKE